MMEEMPDGINLRPHPPPLTRFRLCSLSDILLYLYRSIS